MDSLLKEGEDPASGVAFTALGRDFRLRFGFAAMRAYPRLPGATGEGFLAAVRELRKIEEDPGGFDRVHRLFLAGLSPSPAPEAVDEIIDALGIVPAVALLGRAIRTALPEGKAADADAGDAPSGEP